MDGILGNFRAELTWRKGSGWLDEGVGGFQWKVWKTWVDAVKAKDPSAKIACALHMLKFQYGLETFGPDCDIIGLNLYPNEYFAIPVLGFTVGDYVWSARRALAGMGPEWEKKQVYITETNYPGFIRNNSEEPSSGTSLASNMIWYSDGRQIKIFTRCIAKCFRKWCERFFLVELFRFRSRI